MAQGVKAKRFSVEARITAAVVDHPDTASHDLEAQLTHLVPGLQAPLNLATPNPTVVPDRLAEKPARPRSSKKAESPSLPAGDGPSATIPQTDTILQASTLTAASASTPAEPAGPAATPTQSLPDLPDTAARAFDPPLAHVVTSPQEPATQVLPAPGLTLGDETKSGGGSAETADRPSQIETPLASDKNPGLGEKAPEALSLPDFDALTENMGKLIDYSGKAAAAYLRPRETGEVKASLGDEVTETFRTMGRVAESWFANPARLFQAHASLTSQLFGLWGDSLSRFGTPKAPLPSGTPRKSDKRFAAPEWQGTPMFDFLHQAYLATTDWAKSMIDDAEGVDQPTRDKAAFYLRQISSAISPANFVATNPELLKETFRENGENLVRGMRMLAEDIAAGKGELKIRQSDATKFTLGVDMAATPGKVVFRNDLMELIQYAPSTERVLKRPLLIVPPWINKFYVLDLNKEKSFIRWMISQGLTVFVISWVNPDERHAGKDWDAYMREGIFAALDAIETAIGERDVTTVGYCVGGTLLAATLAFMAANGDTRISSSTLLTTQVDFKHAGDLKIFADEAQIRVIEQDMQNGFLPGSKMANAFNMLRPDDLIWSYAVNTYLKGKPPAAFDLLAWNADSTRMTAANHAFYLRNCYLENRLTAGEMVVGGQRLNLGAVVIPIYDLATKEDHIAPALSVFAGARFFGGPVRYVLAGSGHIAGVVNPPAKAKYQFWTGGPPEGVFEDWVAVATETKGTWWLDWIDWIKAQAPETVAPREPGTGRLPALADAPGDYVRVQS